MFACQHHSPLPTHTYIRTYVCALVSFCLHIVGSKMHTHTYIVHVYCIHIHVCICVLILYTYVHTYIGCTVKTNLLMYPFLEVHVYQCVLYVYHVYFKSRTYVYVYIYCACVRKYIRTYVVM